LWQALSCGAPEHVARGLAQLRGHTAARHDRGGFDIARERFIMGAHATIGMTMRYAHLAPEIARDSVQLLDRRSRLSERGSSVAAAP
jgi:hypothetical protein